MTDLPAAINVELANLNDTHTFVGPEAMADFEQEKQADLLTAEDIEKRWPIMLAIDRFDGEFGVQVVQEQASPLSGDPKLLAAYRESYRTFVGDLRKMHRSLTSVDELEAEILQDTGEAMAEEGLHLLGGYVIGKSAETDTLFSTMFYHKIFSGAYKRGLLASINAGGFDIRRLPLDEQESIEAIARLEDTRETLLACSGLISTFMPHPNVAFP